MNMNIAYRVTVPVLLMVIAGYAMVAEGRKYEIQKLNAELYQSVQHISVLGDEIVSMQAETMVLGRLYLEQSPVATNTGEAMIFMVYERQKKRAIRTRMIAAIESAIHQLTGKRYESRFQVLRVKDSAVYIYEAAQEFQVDPALVIAAAYGESRFRDDICLGYKDSKKGAIGCMQIMKLWVPKLDFVESVHTLRFDLRTNFRAGAAVIRYYLDHPRARGGNPLYAMRMYNYGEGAVAYRDRHSLGYNGYAKAVVKRALRIRRMINAELTDVEPMA